MLPRLDVAQGADIAPPYSRMVGSPFRTTRADRDLYDDTVLGLWCMSQRLTVVYTAVYHLVPQRLMRALGDFIVNPGI
jgi:hypothetical protein